MLKNNFKSDIISNKDISNLIELDKNLYTINVAHLFTLLHKRKYI